MNTPLLDILIKRLSKLPGLGPRSGRRAVLHLLKNREAHLVPLLKALEDVRVHVQHCNTCGNLDVMQPCALCADAKRQASLLCVVEDVDDLWALERSGSYKGHYHVLGGVLSALEGVGPDQLRMESLMQRVQEGAYEEVILALNVTMEGQTTAHYVQEKLGFYEGKITRLSYGVPVGGELDYLDESTLNTALHGRVSIT